MLQSIWIFFGLSLDGFILMMRKGATIRNLTEIRKLTYSFVYALVNLAMLGAGYAAARLFENSLPDGPVQFAVAAVLIAAVGIFVIVKSFLGGPFIERLDRHFNIRTLVRIALAANITTMIIGAGVALVNMPVAEAAAAAFLVSFLMSYAALTIGYTHGASEQRYIGLAGGILMIVFSIHLLIRIASFLG